MLAVRSLPRSLPRPTLRRAVPRRHASTVPWKTPREAGIDSLPKHTPLFEHTPPWWTRWTYFVLGADLFITAVLSELTWNYWTQWEDFPPDYVPADQPPPRAPERQQTPEEDRPKGMYVLRPTWQRAAYVVAQLAVGGGVAALLLIGRSRVVRRLFLLAPPTPAAQNLNALPTSQPLPTTTPADRLVVIQTVYQYGNSGRVFPLRACTLEAGKDHTEALVRVDGLNGVFWLGLHNAKIEGTKTNAWDARDRLLKRWYGEEQAKKLKARAEWGGLWEGGKDKDKAARTK